MGKKGKNKNQTIKVENASKEESIQVSVEKEENKVAEIEKPVEVPIQVEPKVEDIKPESEKTENGIEESEATEGTLKSKKRRNRKKKTTDVQAGELIEEKSKDDDQKTQVVPPKTENIIKKESEPVNTNDENQPNGTAKDTLKKKRRRNKKKTGASNATNENQEEKEETPESDKQNITPDEKSGEDTATSQSNTLKKRKRNRNKNKNTETIAQNETLPEEIIAKPIDPAAIPTSVEAKNEPQRRGKKQKRFDLSSKKTILDELQERQQREQKEAREHIKNEIAKREKLLETIDLVLDCHKSEAELAKNQQESLQDVKKLTSEAVQQQTKPASKSSSKGSKKSQAKKSSPVEEQLVNKIEQVLGMTKLEIQNAQTQQAYISRLETEVAKVKQSKDILLGGQSAPVVPPHIQKMATEMRDISKGEVPKTKEELVKEIESRDALMAEINRVLDTTKSEIDKVQKQQKIIQNLEVELTKMKEQEIVEKIAALEEEASMQEEPLEPPPPKPQSAATASLLDALMANVGKLKEMQALKEKQKAEQATKTEVEKPKPEEKVEQKQTVPPVEQENEKPKLSPKSSPEQSKKHPKDQKKQPQKKQDVEPVVEQKKIVEEKKETLPPNVKPKIENTKLENEKELKPPVDPKKDKQQVSVEPSKPELTKEPAQKQEEPKNEQKSTSPKEVEKKDDNKSKNVEQSKLKIENLEQKLPAKPVETPIKNEEKKIKSAQIEVKPITSAEPNPQELDKKSPKITEQKKNDKGHKVSPKSSHKNKHKHEKKDSPKGIPEVVTLPQVASQKPSMAEMLKNAPDPPPDEIEIKPNEEEKAAPLARPESAIIEVKPSEQIKELPQAEKKGKEEETIIEQNLKESEKVQETAVKTEITPMPVENEAKLEDSMVIVDKAEVEKEMKQEQDDKEPTDPKNVQGSGFVSPADNNNKEQDKDAKPLRKDGKQPTSKARSPVKAPAKTTSSRPTVAKPATPSKPATTKPKLDVQAKVNSKSEPRRSSLQSGSPTKQPSSPITEKLQPKFENTNVSTNNTAQQDNSSTSIEKPKIPPRSDVTKTSNTKPATKAGNVTNQATSPIKPKPPSPSKPPTVTKPATTTTTTATSTAQLPTQTAKPKPTVSQAKPKPTKTTNQKPLATQQKPNSTKTSTAPKSPNSTCDSVFRLRQVTRNNNHTTNNNNKNNQKSFSQPAFRIRMDEKSKSPTIKRPLTTPITPDNNTNNNSQMKAILTKDGTIKIILSSTVTGNLPDKFLSKDVSDTSITPAIANSIVQTSNNDKDDESDEDERYSQYKMTPREIFCASICQVCKVNLSRYFLCHECKMVAYCKEEHMKVDYLNHKGLCMAIQLIAKRRGGHVYNMAKHLSSMEFRNLRLHTIYLCEQFLNRTLLTYEREIFLFPRLCHDVTCREWKSSLLNDCDKCGLESFCALHLLNENHKKSCSSFALLKRIILHEKSYGKIDIALPQKVLRKIPILIDDAHDTMRLLYKNITAFQDPACYSSLMEIATAPLTTFYAHQKVGLEFKDQMTIHFVGAELKFEGDRLEKWESFFLHLAPDISDLQIIFIGSELNCENLPVEIISRKRLCNSCRQNCRGIRYDFQCKKFYHDYCESIGYVKPDFICFFNPAIYRPGFRGFDTWPNTVGAALRSDVPVLFTAATENECYLDLKRIKRITHDDIVILVPPLKNPYSSTRPERNFASDDEDSIIFKNNYLFVVSKTPDLIEL